MQSMIKCVKVHCGGIMRTLTNFIFDKLDVVDRSGCCWSYWSGRRSSWGISFLESANMAHYKACRDLKKL